MSPDRLLTALRHIEVRSHQVLGPKSHAAAMLTAYFSPTGDHRVHDSLSRLSRIPWDFWFDQALAAKLMRPVSPPARALTMSLMTNASCANINDLPSERVTPEQYIARGKITFLFTVLSFLQKKNREIADQLMAELYETCQTLPDLVEPVTRASGERRALRGHGVRRQSRHMRHAARPETIGT
jgi:hypothetical protein